MEIRNVRIGPVELSLPVAKTEAEQRQGLMGRTKLEPNEGMIFEFPRETMTSFWMKDTHVLLDIAFVDADGIFQITSMTPRSEGRTRAIKPYRWAIEMPAGWFDKNLNGDLSCKLSA